MKKASKVLYVIAIIFNILSFFVVAGMFIGSYLMKHYPNSIAKMAIQYGIEELNTAEKVLNMVVPVIIAAIVALAASIVLLIFGLRALKSLEKNEQNSTPHIVMIVLSALCGEVLYLLGGIFGVVNSSRLNRQNTPPPTTNQE